MSHRCHSGSHPMSRPRKITHGRGTSWEVTYRVDGRMVRKRLPSRQLAEQMLAQAQTRALEGTYTFRRDEKKTVADYVPVYLATLRVAESTMKNYETYLRCHVLPALGRRPMSALRRSDVNIFVGQLIEKGLAASTVRHIYALLAMLLRAAVSDRLLV